MKILHTSDWHLGRSLYRRQRYDEFEAFLNWLADTIDEEGVDALLVAGDVFDTPTPSHRAQALYYRFLFRVSASCCRHVVVIAGNHDSPSFLDAPRELLRALNVYVVGAVTERPEDEVIVLDREGVPEAIICAVPYLRDRDIRTVAPGETIDDKNAKLAAGLKEHYGAVCDVALQKQNGFEKEGHGAVPIIAMGHLFTAGGKTVDGDGVRELYVGSLVHVGTEVFPSCIDYLALGHLHVPQVVGHAAHIRYSGAPIPMGYGEADQQKKVVLVGWRGKAPDISELSVPCFRPLVRIVGSLEEIQGRLLQLKEEQSTAWIEVEYTGLEIVGNLRERLDETMGDAEMEIQPIKNRRLMERVIRKIEDEEILEDLDPGEVFVRCLDAADVKEEDRAELIFSYNEIVASFHEEDRNAE